MEFDEYYCLKKRATPKKCDALLKHIAEKMGWIFEPENYEHYSSTQRLPRLEYDVPVYEFRLWYWTTYNGFFFNYGIFDSNFKKKPVRCNDYTIGKIIKIMIGFDKQARKAELQERKKDIIDAAQLYEVKHGKN